MSRYAIIVFSVFCVACASVSARVTRCEVRARTESGLICGVKRRATDGVVYASFRGVPYAKQPVGELRFKELQPADAWGEDYLDASVEGPICPQHDALYGRLMQPRNMSEACIHANIHIPIQALPDLSRPVQTKSLPIFVFVHGGGFAYGSGDSDLHGPEFLIRNNIIVITFNYRINVFGYLSLNSSSIPGNNGLRDIVTLLRWVKANAKYFGGDPQDVTLAGQSAGAASVHLLTLSKAAKGLFQRAIIMSGTAIPAFYTTSPIYSQFIGNQFLAALGINTTDPEEIHQHLINMPIEQIMQANQLIQDQLGITAFLPVVESPFPEVTTILDREPLELLAEGVGKEIPLLVGFTNAECELFRPNFEKIDMLARIKENPLLLLPLELIYKLPYNVALESANQISKRYFDGNLTMDKYIQASSDMYFILPALELAKIRMLTKDAAPMFMYQFSYEAEFNVIKKSKNIEYKGSAHIEDLTFIFRTNSMQNVKGFAPPASSDKTMIDLMTWTFTTFMKCNEPTCTQFHIPAWPSVNHRTSIGYQNIQDSKSYRYVEISENQLEKLKFFEDLFNKTRT